MKAFDVRTVLTFAVSQAEIRLTAPAEKLSMAGTRAIDCSAKKVAATPLEFGSSTPTFSPISRHRLEFQRQRLRARDQRR